MGAGRSRLGDKAGGIAVSLRLYGAQGMPSTDRAWTNLTNALSVMAQPVAEPEFVDVIAEPLRSFDDGIMVTPTLILTAEGRRHTLVGTLDDSAFLARFLAARGRSGG